MAMIDTPAQRWRRRLWITLFVLGILLWCKWLASASTCNHDPKTVEFYENYRVFPAQVIRVEKDEVTAQCRDKFVSKTLVFTMDNQTDPKEKPNKGKWYYFGYCIKCHYLFGYKPV